MHRNKKRTTVNLPEELLKKAKAKNINLSKTLEQALIAKLNPENTPSFFADFFAEKKSWWARRDLNPRPSPCQVNFSKKFNQNEEFDREGFLEDFEDACRIDWELAESTTRERLRYVEKLLDFLDRHPLKVDRKDLRGFLKEYDDDNAKKTLRVLYGRFFDTSIADCFKIPQPKFSPKVIPSDEKVRETFYFLDDLELETAFLLLASSGLRRGELLGLEEEDLVRERRMIVPSKRNNRTKHSWVTFYNEEAEARLEDLGRLPNSLHKDTYTEKFSEASGGDITPQVLRQWFCETLEDLGMSEKYVNVLCGRVPSSVSRRNYSDYRPEKLQERYEKAGLKVLE